MAERAAQSTRADTSAAAEQAARDASRNANLAAEQAYKSAQDSVSAVRADQLLADAASLEGVIGVFTSVSDFEQSASADDEGIVIQSEGYQRYKYDGSSSSKVGPLVTTIEYASPRTPSPGEFWTPPTQPPADGTSGSFVDATSLDYSTLLDNLWEPLRNEAPGYISRTDHGQDASGTHTIYTYEFEPPQYHKTIVVSCGLHGIERMSQVAPYRFFYHLVNDWRDNQALGYARWRVRWIVFPSPNPWGVTEDKRQNSNGVDLNRNWGYLFDEYDASGIGTPDTSSDEFTKTTHGLSDGDIVKIFSKDDSMPSPLNEGQDYYVVNSTTDTFQLSNQSGGSAIDLTSEGGSLYLYEARPFDQSFKGEGAFSESETQIFRDVVDTYSDDCTAVVSFHDVGTNPDIPKFFGYQQDEFQTGDSVATRVAAHFAKEGEQIVLNGSNNPSPYNWAGQKYNMMGIDPEYRLEAFGGSAFDANDLTKAVRWYSNLLLQYAQEGRARQRSLSEPKVINSKFGFGPDDRTVPGDDTWKRMDDYRQDYYPSFYGIAYLTVQAVVDPSGNTRVYLCPFWGQSGTDVVVGSTGDSPIYARHIFEDVPSGDVRSLTLSRVPLPVRPSYKGPIRWGFYAKSNSADVTISRAYTVLELFPSFRRGTVEYRLYDGGDQTPYIFYPDSSEDLYPERDVNDPEVQGPNPL